MPAPAPRTSIEPVQLVEPVQPIMSTPDREFVALYREQFGFVWRMLIHFGIPDAAIEDAAQDVFMVVHRRWADWQPGVSARSWLYGIVRRVAADHRRSRTRHARKLEALPEPLRPPDVEAEVAERELMDALERALAELDPTQRDAFVLAELEGMTAKEIGDALGANPNTVASRLRAARAHVGTALATTRTTREGRDWLPGRRHARAQ
ncbi:RNA polymerase sigma factor [Nannocystaceae bacterium ST9]